MIISRDLTKHTMAPPLPSIMPGSESRLLILLFLELMMISLVAAFHSPSSSSSFTSTLSVQIRANKRTATVTFPTTTLRAGAECAGDGDYLEENQVSYFN